MATCKLGSARDAMGATDRDTLDHWLATGLDGRGVAVSAVTMSHALLDMGYVAMPTTVKDHRGGRCVCRRED